MDVAVIINGVVDCVYRDHTIADMPTIPNSTFVECEPNTVFGDFTYADGVFTAPPVDTTPIIPQSITPAQGRIALKRAGLLDQVKALVEQAGTDSELEIWWDFATVWERSNSNITALSGQLGLTGDQVDQMFITAAAIA